jgi:hypothetical protein
LALAAIGLVVACGDDPSPVKPSPLTPSPFAAIQVMGPDSIGTGETAQFVASLRQADGTTKSATSMPNLKWASSNTAVMFVSSSGVVTASDSIYGESVFGKTVISAELVGQPSLRGTREVVIQPPVTGTLEVTQIGTGGKVEYVFAVTLTELKGVPAIVTAAWIDLNLGLRGQCIFDPARLGQRRVPANGTLTLELTCPSDGPASNADVAINLTDDNGHELQLFLWWAGKL